MWVLISTALLPVWSILLDRPTTFVWLTGALLGVMAVKRLTSNFISQSNVSLPRLLWNRLVYDRDIADHDSWVRNSTASHPGGNSQ